MFIVYKGDDEVLVTTSKKENLAIREYFIEGGRDLDDYDRIEVEDCAVQVLTDMIVT
jgi:hypothetical protein